MAAREDEPVTVGPGRFARVVGHHLRPQDVGEGSEGHGRARMPGVGPLGGVHRQAPDDVDAQLLKVALPHGQTVPTS